MKKWWQLLTITWILFQLTYNSLIITSYLTTISDVGRNTNSNILMCKQNQNDGYLWSYGAINSSPIDSIKIMILTQSDEHYICNKDFNLDLTSCFMAFIIHLSRWNIYKVICSFMFIIRKDLNLNFSLYINSLFRSDNISGISWWLILFKIIFDLFLCITLYTHYCLTRLCVHGVL